MENNGKNNNILPLVVIFLVIAGLIGGAYWFGKSSIMQNSQTDRMTDVKESTEPEQPVVETSENIEEAETEEETDEEGSLEEEVETEEETVVEEESEIEGESDEAVIESLKILFAQKYEKRIEDITVTISKREGDYLTGGVKFAEEVAGGYVLAAKVNGAWKIVFDGNGNWTCSAVDVVDFPSTLAPECWDENTMTMVDRTAN